MTRAGLVLPGQLAEALAFGHLPESRLLLRNVSSGLTNDCGLLT